MGDAKVEAALSVRRLAGQDARAAQAGDGAGGEGRFQDPVREHGDE